MVVELDCPAALISPVVGRAVREQGMEKEHAARLEWYGQAASAGHIAVAQLPVAALEVSDGAAAVAPGPQSHTAVLGRGFIERYPHADNRVVAVHVEIGAVLMPRFLSTSGRFEECHLLEEHRIRARP